MYDYITRFGFGSRTGIELPGETAGLVRPLNRWQPSSIGSVAIGQEVGVTPLQMAAAFGALANDGVRIAPHLIREIRNTSGGPSYRPNPEQRRVISRETASALRGMLEGVTLNGTAKKAQLDGYTAAGKTGTAQKIDAKTKTYSKTKFVASFVGFAPVNNPAVVIIVVIDEPGGAYHGGDVAAPVFRQIAEQILPEMGVIPDTDFKNPELVARAVQTPAQISKLRQDEKRRDRREPRGRVQSVDHAPGYRARQQRRRDCLCGRDQQRDRDAGFARTKRTRCRPRVRAVRHARLAKAWRVMDGRRGAGRQPIIYGHGRLNARDKVSLRRFWKEPFN